MLAFGCITADLRSNQNVQRFFTFSITIILSFQNIVNLQDFCTILARHGTSWKLSNLASGRRLFFQNYVIKCRHDCFQNIAEFQRFRSYSYQGVQIIRYSKKSAEILRRCSRIFTGDNSFLRGNHFNVPSGSTQSAVQPDAHPADFVTPKKKSVVSACGKRLAAPLAVCPVSCQTVPRILLSDPR